MKKLLSIVLIVVVLIIPQAGCKAQANNAGISKTGFYLDTVCQITIYSMENMEDKTEEEQEKEALLLITDAFKLCTEYENMLSKTIEGSDVYNINHANGESVTVDDDTIEVIKKGIEFGDISGGAFDITIGKVSDLWNFHEEDEDGDKTGTIPDADVISEAVTHVDYNNIVIDGNTVSLKDPEAEIDLGGIAKGYIADKVTEFLISRGVTSAVVDLGGNIVAIGEKGASMTDSEGTDFVIGIADPHSDSRELLGTLECRDKTIVTSGTYERYFEVDGVRYHHVLNPETGYPDDTDLMSVSIISDLGSSADCDGLSTTCLALGMEKGLELIQSIDGVEAVFVGIDGTVKLSDENLAFKMS